VAVHRIVGRKHVERDLRFDATTLPEHTNFIGVDLLAAETWIVDARGRFARVHVSPWTGLSELVAGRQGERPRRPEDTEDTEEPDDLDNAATSDVVRNDDDDDDDAGREDPR
jgi:hypothetical protein